MHIENGAAGASAHLLGMPAPLFRTALKSLVERSCLAALGSSYPASTPPLICLIRAGVGRYFMHNIENRDSLRLSVSPMTGQRASLLLALTLPPSGSPPQTTLI